MPEKVCLGTGWYSDGKPTNIVSSPKMYETDWLTKWREFHNAYQFFDATTVYESNCTMLIQGYSLSLFTAHAIGQKHNFHARHDWWASFIFGLNYAYANDMHYVYIEQDCLVKGLDKAVEMAIDSDKPMFYGIGKYSYSPGWAEHSFCFVKKDFVKHALYAIVYNELDRMPHPTTEVIFHNVFEDVVEPWPFGYGRHPVENWEDEIFYKQQVTPEELEKFGV